jgi:nucleoside-diphosphate-sugar epimerase
VVGVARFSDPLARALLEEAGVVTVPCDLLDRQAVARLPDAEDVIYLAGRKFGTSGDEADLTWAMNAVVPANVAHRYAASRIVALSTGCVYPLSAVGGHGSHEDDPLGGWLTTEEMVERDRIVFETLARKGIPVAWNLAGGYQEPIERVLGLHSDTMRVALEVERGHGGIGRSSGGV